MATLAKNLKDSNGNVILPKTRAEWVYLSDNSSVESKLSSLPSIDQSLMIYKCIHSKSSTIHVLVCNDLPVSDILHLSFISTADYILGDTFTINDVAYTGKLYSLEILPDNIFKNGTLVNIDIDTESKTCFFKSGGISEPPPPNEPEDTKETYQIIQAFTTNTVWIVPENNWYRIIAVGKSGNGGNGGPFGSTVGSVAGTGAGGNVGGIACSTLYLKKDLEIQITINDVSTSFGSDISATTGGNGGNGLDPSVSYNEREGKVSAQFGDAYGGNKANIIGMQGFGLGNSPADSINDNWGGWFQSNIVYINQYFVSSGDLSQYCASGRPGKSHIEWFNLHVLLSGGGGGGLGGKKTAEHTYVNPGAGGAGQPGVCIVQKAI